MTATLQDIQRWLETAEQNNSSHLIVAVDTYDHSNYPVYVSHNESVWDEEERITKQSMQGVDEIYNMKIDIKQQLSEFRARNY